MVFGFSGVVVELDVGGFVRVGFAMFEDGEWWLVVSVVCVRFVRRGS